MSNKDVLLSALFACSAIIFVGSMLAVGASYLVGCDATPTPARACAHLERISGAEQGDECVESLDKMGDECPDSYESMLGCVMDQKHAEDAVPCMGGCFAEALRRAAVEAFSGE